FHCLVAFIDNTQQDIKQVTYAQSSLAAERVRLLEGAFSLISWLTKEGVKDVIKSNGKTAAQKAHQLGMPEVARRITNELEVVEIKK
ncbi:hypothetical protein H0X06_06920, partial [Candidatus Dependentiae bacterium]|nr:hypothetical protein [Candidatus Dependentiae bacterium]